MLDGWRAQMLARGLTTQTIKQRSQLLERSSRFDKDLTAIIRASYEWMDSFIPELNVQTTLFDYDDVEPEKEAELRRLFS